MDFKFTTLGISAAGPVPGRWASGHWLKAGGIGFLIDCGEGIQISLQKNSIGWSSIDVILISHLHGDHIYGLPGLLSSWGLNSRTSPLLLVAPESLKTMLEAFFNNNLDALGFSIEWVFTQTDSVSDLLFENKLLTVHSLRLKHRVPTTGFLIKEKERPLTILREAIEQYSIPYQEINAIKAGADFKTSAGEIVPNHLMTQAPPPSRSFAYCSDTSPNVDLIPYISGVDLLYHEATFLHEMLTQAELSGHSTALQAAEVAVEAKVGQLILGHFSPRYKTLGGFLTEARTVFKNTTLSKEGRVFDVPYQGRK